MKKNGFKLTAALVAAVTLLVSSCGAKEKVKLSQLIFEEEQLIALNHNAEISAIENPDEDSYAFFRFTDAQMEKIRSLKSDDSPNAIVVELVLPEGQRGASFEVGMIKEEDFNEKGEFAGIPDNRPAVVGKNGNSDTGKLRVSFAYQRPPRGFFVKALSSVTVSSVSFEPAVLGWDRSSESTLFGFGYAGGKIDGDFFKVDFASQGDLFCVFNSQDEVMPRIEIGLVPVSDVGDWQNQLSIRMSYGGENFRVRRAVGQNRIVLQTAGLKGSSNVIHFTENGEQVVSALMMANKRSLAAKNGKVLEPLETDLGLVLDWPEKNWRGSDYELFSWSLFPKVLFFDFVSYEVQDQYLTRLAYFVEKEGYKGTFVSNDFILRNHGYNAHDYKAVDLAEFFTQAVKQNFELNERELTLRSILLRNKIILANSDGTFSEGEGAIISISKESKPATRVQLMAHECWHGIYFTRPEFRALVSELYDNFDSTYMSFLKIYFKTQPGLNYDINDDYLMRNEFMAYILQNSLGFVRDYFITRANWNSVQINEGPQANYVIRTKGQAFYDACRAMSDFVFDNWGLAAGRVYLMTRD